MTRFLKSAAVAVLLVAGATAAQAGGFAGGYSGASGNWDVLTYGYGSGMGEVHTYSANTSFAGYNTLAAQRLSGTPKYQSNTVFIGAGRYVGNAGSAGSFGGVMTNGYAAGSAWGMAESSSISGIGSMSGHGSNH